MMKVAIGCIGCLILFVLCPFGLLWVSSIPGYSLYELFLLMIYIIVWGACYAFFLGMTGALGKVE